MIVQQYGKILILYKPFNQSQFSAVNKNADIALVERGLCGRNFVQLLSFDRTTVRQKEIKWSRPKDMNPLTM